MAVPTQHTCARPAETVRAAYTVAAAAGARRLDIEVTRAGCVPRIAVVVRDGSAVEAAGLVLVRDVRRIARAVGSGRASATVALRAAGPLAGGTVVVQQDGDDVFLVARLPHGARLFGPVPSRLVSLVCRDVVTWHRLLSREDERAAASVS